MGWFSSFLFFCVWIEKNGERTKGENSVGVSKSMNECMFVVLYEVCMYVRDEKKKETDGRGRGIKNRVLISRSDLSLLSGKCPPLSSLAAN